MENSKVYVVCFNAKPYDNGESEHSVLICSNMAKAVSIAKKKLRDSYGDDVQIDVEGSWRECGINLKPANVTIEEGCWLWVEIYQETVK